MNLVKIKKERKFVDNSIYTNAYENKDNQQIIKSVLSKYRGRLTEETLKSCGLNALWRCLQQHDEKYTTKFTSSLWRFVHWECKKELKTLARSKFRPQELTDIAEEVPLDNLFDDISSILDQEQAKIVKLRFLEGMTLKEIGNTFGVTKEAVRLKLKKALNQIKKLVYNT